MKKCLKILGVLLLALFCLSGCSNSPAASGGYTVILPKDYDKSISDYPVLYVLPEDGYAQEEGMEVILQREMEVGRLLNMIIVKPCFQKDENISERMAEIVKEVDADFRTIDHKKYRALLGTGVGGYLAYAIGLEERELFGAMASIRGDFASEENPWLAVNGSVCDTIEKMQDFGAGYFDEIYTYIDAPVNDVWTDMEGSTNDIGKLFIEMGTSSAAHEFTVRAGEFDEYFLEESVYRVEDRLTKYMLGDIFTGTLKLENATLPEEEATAKALFSIDVANTVNDFTLRDFEVEVKVAVTDAQTGEVLTENSTTVNVTDDGTYDGNLEVENLVNGDSSELILSIDVFGCEYEVAKATLRRGQGNVLEGDVKSIDLSGDWHFYYAGMEETLDVATLSPAEYETWPVVQPGDGKWREGYGNITKDTVSGPAEYFTYMLTGNGYYVKDFEVPEAFDSFDLTLSIGYVDDRCEVYLNGKVVGATGMNEAGEPNGETTWAKLSEFSVDPELLVRGGENTVVVRAWNDEPYGEGGWYEGPVMLTGKGGKAETSQEDEDGKETDTNRFFYEETFASNLIDEGEYLIYLPQDYYETEHFYPTMYLLHQFNSDHTSYQTDKINEVLDTAIKNGCFDEMIVVIPNSEEESWWTGKWEQMLTEELIPHIDQNYRTINDARYRMTAGCSMGGQGAFGVALTNPQCFSGMVSFFGALSMAPTRGEDAILIAGAESKEYLDYFSYSFICGNQDSYGFGVPAIDLHQILADKGIDHHFFIENGGHDSAFYLPHFTECVSYVWYDMYKSDNQVTELIHVSAKTNGTKAEVSFEAEEGIKEYFNEIPESSYTEKEQKKLVIPLVISVKQDGKVVHTEIVRENEVTEEKLNASYKYDFSEYVEAGKPLDVTVKAAVFDRIAE